MEVKALLKESLRRYLHVEIIRTTTRHVKVPHFPGVLLDVTHIDILQDREFLNAVERASSATILDIPRLANLWNFARMSNPEGAMLEVGSFRGGSARLIADACPKRKILVCDTFSGFESMPIDTVKDGVFYRDQFNGAHLDGVKKLFSETPSRARFLVGCFPESDREGEVKNISFAHLDCDLFASMRDSLEYLSDKFLPRSLMLVDDYRRNASGVDEAVRNWVESHPDWCAFPLFPGQGLLIHRSWFSGSGAGG